jgi:hypothetical protein
MRSENPGQVAPSNVEGPPRSRRSCSERFRVCSDLCLRHPGEYFLAYAQGAPSGLGRLQIGLSFDRSTGKTDSYSVSRCAHASITFEMTCWKTGLRLLWHTTFGVDKPLRLFSSMLV